MEKYFDAVAFGEAMGEIVREAFELLEKRVADLEQSGIKFCGVHQRALDYARGSVVISGGSSWVAVKANPAGVPGDSPDWALMARAGRDGRDAR